MLFNCPKCEKMCSTLAVSCPHCGHHYGDLKSTKTAESEASDIPKKDLRRLICNHIIKVVHKMGF